MKLLNKKINLLNELLAINHQAEKVYLEALDVADSEDLKQFFRARAFERNEFCRYLGAEIRLLGGIPNFADDVESKHRLNYPDFKKVIASDNPRALFHEINRLKTFCLKHYNKVLSSFDFSESLKNLLERQRQIIGTSISLLRYRDGVSNQQLQLSNP